MTRSRACSIWSSTRRPHPGGVWVRMRPGPDRRDLENDHTGPPINGHCWPTTTDRAAAAGPPAGDQRDPLAGRHRAPWRDIPERYGPWETCYCLVPHTGTTTSTSAVSVLAARRHLGRRAHQAAGSRGREGPDHLGRVGRLHRGSGASGRRRGSAKGDDQV
jgi:hypothetical protein